MPDITRIQIADEPERSYKDFPANREFKKRAEDENSGSSSDPIVENAKETGGIGWTEQVYTKIFDGEVVSWYVDLFQACMVNVDSADIIRSIGTKYRLTVDGETCELIVVDDEGNFSMLEKISGTLNPQFDDLQISDDEISWWVYTTEAASYNIQLEIAESAVHTIDEKYLPEADSGLPEANKAGSAAIWNGQEWVAMPGYETNNVTVTGQYAHAEGNQTKAMQYGDHAEGYKSEATGCYSHAEGYTTKAAQAYAHAEGYQTQATGLQSHAEGNNTEASDYSSHAEGTNTKANGDSSHAEGCASEANGDSSHAEGYQTKATDKYAHTEGCFTIASGEAAHAEGHWTLASSKYQHTEGEYNIADANNKYAHIIGNGTSNQSRHNCFMVGWDGAIYVQASDDTTKMMKITVASDGTITATQVTV